MGNIRFVGLAASLLTSVAMTGCSVPVPVGCPEMAWSNTFTVTLTGSARDAALVELCIVDLCTESTLIEQERETISPTPVGVPMPLSISRVGEREWHVSVVMATPETLTVRSLSSAGEVLAEREVALEWQRVGGSEQCGGPSEAEPVGLDIPY